MLTTLGWHQGKVEVFADVEEDTQNIFQIKGSNYCREVHEVSRASRPAIVFALEQAALSLQERKQGDVSHNRSCMYQAAIYILKFFALSPARVYNKEGGANNGNIDLEIFEFWLCRQTVKENCQLSELQQQCSYTNSLLSWLFYIARDQYSSFSQQD